MRTYNRLCIKTTTFEDGDRKITLERGKEYTTSAVNSAPAIGPDAVEDHVIVFTGYWFPAPISIFAGEEVFTK
jgi:hypothetical protein